MNLLYPSFTLRQFGWMFVFGLAGSLVAGCYGILHDQITFTVGREYFTEFKFYQFHWLDQSQPMRLIVAEIGFLATWWVGFIAAWFMGRVTLPHLALKAAALRSLCGVFMILCFAVVFACVAFAISPRSLEDGRMAHWQALLVPGGVKDAVAFVQVGYIHNASYLGGLVGLIAALLWLRVTRRAGLKKSD